MLGHYSNSATELAPLTDTTPELLAVAFKGLQKIYRPGFLYKRAGVMLGDFAPASSLTMRLWGQAEHDRMRRVMQAVDALNTRLGRDTIRCGLHPLEGQWSMKAARRSPRYTTQWSELLDVH